MIDEMNTHQREIDGLTDKIEGMKLEQLVIWDRSLHALDESKKEKRDSGV